MADINAFLNLSTHARAINDLFAQPDEFRETYARLWKSEKESYIRHVLIRNIAFVFQERPFVFERLSEYLAERLQINCMDSYLVGSGKCGFSISPQPRFGAAFSPTSDLDFAIVNTRLFRNISDEFKDWHALYTSGELQPRNQAEELYWPENATTCLRNIGNGFIDGNKVPIFYQFPSTQRLNQSLAQVTSKLASGHQIVVKKCTARIYETMNTFISRLKFNTESVLGGH